VRTIALVKLILGDDAGHEGRAEVLEIALVADQLATRAPSTMRS
jgi:hypothetical protein